jgi:membrane-bound inhibitor of C-type lysozyme
MPRRPVRVAPALPGESVRIDDLVAATIAETERDATAKAARAFYAFWSTGDEARLKQALEENFADHACRRGVGPSE